MQNGQVQRHIIDRAPYTRSGEVTVKASSKGNVVPDRSTSHNMDRDFEVPYLTFKFTALAEGAVTDPQPDVLDRLVKIKALDHARNHPIGDSLPLTNVDENGTYRWTPRSPLLLRRGDAFQIQVDARESFDIAFDGKRLRVDEIRVEVTFEGELLTYGVVPADKSKFEGEAPLAG